MYAVLCKENVSEITMKQPNFSFMISIKCNWVIGKEVPYFLKVTDFDRLSLWHDSLTRALAPSFMRFLDLTRNRTRARMPTHTHSPIPDKTPLSEWSSLRRRGYVHNTQETQETNLHVLTGIRTRDPKNLTVKNLSLRPHGHNNWLFWLWLGHYEAVRTYIKTWKRDLMY